MVGTLCRQLLKGSSAEEMQKLGVGGYYADHGLGVYTQGASGVPFDATCFAVKDDPITDLTEDMAADVAPFIVQNFKHSSEFQ